jgi:EF hand
LSIGNNDVFGPDIFKSPATRISSHARRRTEMKKMTAIVVALLTVGVYADFASAQDAPKQPDAQKEGDAPRRPGAEGGRRPGADGGRRPGAPGAEGGRRPGGFGGGPGGGSFMSRLPIFAAIDEDKDGVLSEKEIANATAALKTLDKNKDGKLDEEELRPDFGGRGPGGRPGAGADGPRRPATTEKEKENNN